MTAIYPTSPEEMAVVRGRNKRPKRYLSVCPRRVWMTGVVASVVVDTETEGIYALELADVDGDEAMAEMTVDIGTSPGARDIGSVRVRENGTTTLAISLTSFGEVPVQVGHYVTVREEFRPWQIGFRLIPVYNVSGVITDILEYMDFDNDFGEPHEDSTPKANIYAGLLPDTSDWMPLRPADWCDKGEVYRTVALWGGGEPVWSGSNGFTAAHWDLGDGEIIAGNADNPTVTVRFPAGFRYIHYTVTNDNGFQHTMHFPIWAHHKTLYPPITLTGIPRDETERWREMSVEFNGMASEYSEDVIPQGCACCYWEDRNLFVAGAAPIAYRDHAYGWVIEDTSLLTLGGGYALTFAGAGWWLDHFDGPTQALRDNNTPSAWHEIREITRDRALYFSLLHFCNIASLVNIRFYGLPFSQTTMRINLEPGSIWQQNETTAARYSVSVLGSDSFGNIIIDREYNHLSALERASLLPLLHLEAQDWTDEGIPLTTRNETNYSRVEGAGNIFYVGELLFASVAPGKVKSAGTNIAQLEGQYLPFYSAQAALNNLTGQRWRALNNPQTGIPITLLNNLDVIEPCWQRPILISWNKPTVRGTLLQQAKFVVKRVTIEHNFDVLSDAPPKKVVWEVDRTTLGFPGVTIPVIQSEGSLYPPDPDPEPEPGDLMPSLLRGTQTIAVFARGSARVYYVTYDWLSTNPTWYTVSLASLLPAGEIQNFEPDPFSPFYLGTGAAVNGWLFFRKTDSPTGLRIYKINDIFGTPSLSLQLDYPAAALWGGVQTERGVQGWVVATALMQTPNPGAGIKSIKTVDGVNWNIHAIPQVGSLAASALAPGMLSPAYSGAGLCRLEDVRRVLDVHQSRLRGNLPGRAASQCGRRDPRSVSGGE